MVHLEVVWRKQVLQTISLHWGWGLNKKRGRLGPSGQEMAEPFMKPVPNLGCAQKTLFKVEMWRIREDRDPGYEIPWVKSWEIHPCRNDVKSRKYLCASLGALKVKSLIGCFPIFRAMKSNPYIMTMVAWNGTNSSIFLGSLTWTDHFEQAFQFDHLNWPNYIQQCCSKQAVDVMTHDSLRLISLFDLFFASLKISDTQELLRHAKTSESVHGIHSFAVQGSRYGTSFAFHADLAVRGALVSWTSHSQMQGKSGRTPTLSTFQTGDELYRNCLLPLHALAQVLPVSHSCYISLIENHSCHWSLLRWPCFLLPLFALISCLLAWCQCSYRQHDAGQELY